ncbi:hypothetical protein HanHA300_Chr02g0049061 [Helianthus annuus]|nr:hypothetical protein HanHA300_Chr02g0049061 [Helianthus annuus]KAJ0776852.1 hypothetical protein HanLR1_Chr02g0050441 [Helianthus annuus]
MNSEFYNAFATSTTPAAIAQAMNLENETGTTQKPPKLMSIEEYYGWKDRFENWVQANHLRSWNAYWKSTHCLEQNCKSLNRYLNSQNKNVQCTE